MKLLVLTREGTDYSRTVYEFVEMFARRYPSHRVEELNLDTREGAAIASLYDVFSYPAFLATTNDGRVLNMWQGVPPPLIDEVAGQLLA